MSPQSVERKEKRRKSLERKKNDRVKVPRGPRDPKLHQRVVENKDKGGSKNLTRFYEEDND